MKKRKSLFNTINSSFFNLTLKEFNDDTCVFTFWENLFLDSDEFFWTKSRLSHKIHYSSTFIK